MPFERYRPLLKIDRPVFWKSQFAQDAWMAFFLIRMTAEKG
jgi:hypothetical protein